MRTRHHITISISDYDRLLALIDSARLDWRMPAEHLNSLEGELARATLVATDELPPDVVAMQSTVWFRDLDTQEVDQYQLVYPTEADITAGRISVLAPIGTALLGYRVGDIVKWRVPLGSRRLEITRVVQPKGSEAAEQVLV
jgi:regulator of nucleoside diphosphate kinase